MIKKQKKNNNNNMERKKKNNKKAIEAWDQATRRQRESLINELTGAGPASQGKDMASSFSFPYEFVCALHSRI